MVTKLSRHELEKKLDDGTYLDFVRSVMKDFCLTVDRHAGKDRTWFGDYTVTINRNVAFSFFAQDATADPGLEPYPVIRGDRTETRTVRVRSEPDDPSSEMQFPAFFLGPADWRAVVESLEQIKNDYGDLRTLPDAYFEDTALIRALRAFLEHPQVQADRKADWPSLLR